MRFSSYLVSDLTFAKDLHFVNLFSVEISILKRSSLSDSLAIS